MTQDSRTPHSRILALAGMFAIVTVGAMAVSTPAPLQAQPSEAFDRLVKLPTGVGDASFFGEVIVKGDADGDGRDDVAISGRINSGSGDRGQVRILRGAAPHAIVVDTLIIGSILELAGTALAFGDFDDDGKDELAIGRPRRNAAGETAAGDVGIRRRLPDGSWPEVGNWNQESTDISGVPEAEDLFGSALAVGDFDDDGVDDLAIGVPGEAVGATAAAGAVQILYGIAGLGLQATGNQLFHQDSTGVPGGAEAGDRFGSVIATGDVTCDGIDDLVVGTPDEDGGATIDVGTVTVLPGSIFLGIDPSGGVRIVSQRIAGTLIPNGAATVRIEAGVEAYDSRVSGEFMDYFGAALAAPDLDDDGLADLVVGMPLSDLDGDTLSGGAQVFFSALFAEDFEGNDLEEWDAVQN